MCVFKLVICGVLIFGCTAAVKIEVRSTGLVVEPPPGVYDPPNSYKTVGVLHGHPLEVFCTGENAEDLRIEEFKNSPIYFGRDYLKSEIINQTTRKYFLSAPDKLNKPYTYSCNEEKTWTSDKVNVIIDSRPEITNFQCVWNLTRYFVTCDWGSPNKIGYNELYRTKNGRQDQICRGLIQPHFSCMSGAPIASEFDLEFRVHACTYFGCKDFPFSLWRNTILKFDPPTDLRVLKKGSHFIILRWNQFLPIEVSTYRLGIMYKVEYQMDGGEFRQVNATPSYNYKEYSLRIDLPCADKSYQVRVSVKRTKSLWSDYSSIYFNTEPASDVVDTDSQCLKPVDNHELPMYQVQLFWDILRADLKKLKAQIDIQKEKNETIPESMTGDTL